jgi:hypothetical protein
MLKVLAILFGILLLIVGIIGYIPEYTKDGHLFGLFAVNSFHNIVHIASGVIGILCGLSSSTAAKAFFIIFGLIYAAVAFLGFYYGEGLLFGWIMINTADNWLHVGIAAISLYFGLFLRRRYS